MDKRVLGKPGAKIGLVAAGKNWLDLVHALDTWALIAEAEAERLGHHHLQGRPDLPAGHERVP